MAEPGKSLRLQDLLTRGEQFRWLWVQHNEVAAMKATDKRVWQKLARIGRANGMAVTRESLRSAWRTVEAEWARAPDELKSARIFEERRVEHEKRPAIPVQVVGVEGGGGGRPPDDDDIELVSVKKPREP